MKKDQRIARLLQQKETIAAQLLALPNVCGIAVGYQYKNGQRTRRLVISVHVTQKISSIEPLHRIPDKINGIKTDVIEMAFGTNHTIAPVSRSLVALRDTKKYPIIKGGIAIGLKNARVEQRDGQKVSIYEPGTLGAVVFDRKNHDPYLLSNYHVLAANGFNNDEPVMQPSPGDSGNANQEIIAKVSKAICNEAVDCAIAQLEIHQNYEHSIVDIGAINGAASVTVGVQVRKRGRTTQLTHGTIEQIGMTIKASFMGKTRTFTNQILIRTNPLKSLTFAAHGDSGAVVVDSHNNIVGLLFLISQDGQTAVMNPISAVMNALDIVVTPPLSALTLPILPLKLFAKGQRVKQVQEALNKHGHTPALGADGVFGHKLLQAVKWFQAKVGLKTDGVVEQNTWNALLNG